MDVLVLDAQDLIIAPAIEYIFFGLRGVATVPFFIMFIV